MGIFFCTCPLSISCRPRHPSVEKWGFFSAPVFIFFIFLKKKHSYFNDCSLTCAEGVSKWLVYLGFACELQVVLCSCALCVFSLCLLIWSPNIIILWSTSLVISFKKHMMMICCFCLFCVLCVCLVGWLFGFFFVCLFCLSAFVLLFFLDCFCLCAFMLNLLAVATFSASLFLTVQALCDSVCRCRAEWTAVCV